MGISAHVNFLPFETHGFHTSRSLEIEDEASPNKTRIRFKFIRLVKDEQWIVKMNALAHENSFKCGRQTYLAIVNQIQKVIKQLE